MSEPTSVAKLLARVTDGKERLNLISELAVTALDQMVSKDLAGIVSETEVIEACSGLNARWSGRIWIALQRAGIEIDAAERKVIERDIAFRVQERQLEMIRSLQARAGPPAAADPIQMGILKIRTEHLERISKAAHKREKRERLCDFAGAVMDWGATRAIHAVGDVADVGVFVHKLKFFLCLPFWMDLEDAEIRIDEEDLEALNATIQGRLIHWEAEARKRLEGAVLAEPGNSHEARVAQVDEHFGRNGAAGKPPYTEFYKPLEITASEFSNWKRRRWQRCGKEKKAKLDSAADALFFC